MSGYENAMLVLGMGAMLLLAFPTAVRILCQTYLELRSLAHHAAISELEEMERR